MVSTRGHPKVFADPISSASKPGSARSRKTRWAHTPSNLLLLWLAVSLPLVMWDTGYVLLRPHSMPGGWAHSPIWVPYDLYGRVDHVYGWKAYNAGSGFTAAQATMNVIETLLYLYYLVILYVYGSQTGVSGRGAPAPERVGALGESRCVDGKRAGLAVVALFTAAVMTFSKTVLYGLHEYYSSFENIKHNTTWDLIFLWILPNGMWLIFPFYMSYVAGSEILEGLAIASGGSPLSDDSSLTKTS